MQIDIYSQSNSLPQYMTDGAVAFDYSASADVDIAPKAIEMVPTGVIIRVPDGYGLFIFARSSLHKKGLMLANSVGVIDNDYCGSDDYHFIALYNFSDQRCQIKAGDRIAQGVFIKITKADWRQFKPKNASRGGWGSTGK